MVDPSNQVIVVSNREPYVHETTERVIQPAGGLTAALDGALAATGGTWIAWGSGDADFTVADDGRIAVPPDAPAYQLRRLRLDDELRDKYYYGYSNQVLWPLCHQLIERVRIGPGFWDAYQAVNEQFATAIGEELTDPRGTVWLQDYHLARVPRFLDGQIDDRVTVQSFWHIPWPPATCFDRCPQAGALLDGLLAADRIGFHTTAYADAFGATVKRHLPAATVVDDRTIRYRDTTTDLYVSPIGVDTDAVRTAATTPRAQDVWDRVVRAWEITPDETIAVAVDRLDYTKGILHRLEAIEQLLTSRPSLQGQFRLVQKGTNTREQIDAYARYQRRISAMIDRINNRFGTEDWVPIVYLPDTLPHEEVIGLLAAGDIGVVTPLADGFNLTALEYVLARNEEPGALVLSQYAGAAEYLNDGAYLVNPHDITAMTEQLEAALDATSETRTHRWNRLREQAAELDITAWLAAGGITPTARHQQP